MVKSPQDIYIHDSHIIQDDGEMLHEVSLNTRGETPQDSRERIYEMVYKAGVDPAQLYNEVNTTIGKVWFTENGEIMKVNIKPWVLDEYGIQ